MSEGQLRLSSNPQFRGYPISRLSRGTQVVPHCLIQGINRAGASGTSVVLYATPVQLTVTV